MKKKILAVLLAITMVTSLSSAFAVEIFAAEPELSPIMGKTMIAMRNEISSFISIAAGQIERDDYQNMPEGLQNIHPQTLILQEKHDRARTVRSSGDINLMEEFLLEIYGGWDPEKGSSGDYLEGNKP